VTRAVRASRPRWWPGVAAKALWALAMLSLPVIAWLDHRSRQAGRPDLVQLATGSVPPVLALVSAATVGVVLASRRPRHPVGWLLLILGLSLAVSGVAAAYTAYGLVARPGALPAAGAVARYAPVLVLVVLPALSFVLLLTPTGSLPSARWRWWARVTGTAPVVLLVALVVARGSLDPRYQAENSPLDFRGLGGALLVVNQAALAVTLLTLIVAAASLVVRFRRARGMERQQLRWVAWAAVLVVLAAVIALASSMLGLPEVVGWAAGICVALLPLAIGAAILRYRLYDLDRIVSRTLTWGLLTVLLGGGYAVVVLGLGQLLGRESPLVVAAATLAVAALFQPVRRRIQQAVDRRFNRRRHDAAHRIAAFSNHLREQVDLDALTAELLAVAEETMQPTQASLWLRPTHAPSTGAGAHPGPAT
jgi:hypothetical protein